MGHRPAQRREPPGCCRGPVNCYGRPEGVPGSCLISSMKRPSPRPRPGDLRPSGGSDDALPDVQPAADPSGQAVPRMRAGARACAGRRGLRRDPFVGRPGDRRGGMAAAESIGRAGSSVAPDRRRRPPSRSASRPSRCSPRRGGRTPRQAESVMIDRDLRASSRATRVRQPTRRARRCRVGNAVARRNACAQTGTRSGAARARGRRHCDQPDDGEIRAASALRRVASAGAQPTQPTIACSASPMRSTRAAREPLFARMACEFRARTRYCDGARAQDSAVRNGRRRARR